MQVNLLPHNLRHNKVCVQLVVHKIKQSHMERCLRRLPIGNKDSRHSAHQRTDNRDSLRQNRPKAQHQRELYAERGRADRNHKAGNQAELRQAAHIGAQRAANIVNNGRCPILHIIVKKIDRHLAQLAPVLKEIKRQERHDNQADKTLHNTQAGLHKVAQHRAYKAHRPVHQRRHQHIKVRRQQRNLRRILQHSVDVMHIRALRLRDKQRQLLQKFVHLTKKRQQNKADNHHNEDAKRQQCQDNRHHARQLDHAVRHTHLGNRIYQRIQRERQTDGQQQRQQKACQKI